MSLIFATQLTAVATAVLAAFAIVTAWYARRAFLKQSKEVSDQAEMLDLQRKQLAEQQKTSAKQAEVLALQADELRESLEERKREAEERRMNQAHGVVAWFGLGIDPTARGVGRTMEVWGATIRNASDLPVLDVQVSFYWIDEPTPGLGWTPIRQGSSTQILRVLPPQRERHVRIPEEVRSQMDQCSDDVYAVSIWFTDAAGNRWERDARGALNPLS